MYMHHTTSLAVRQDKYSGMSIYHIVIVAISFSEYGLSEVHIIKLVKHYAFPPTSSHFGYQELHGTVYIDDGIIAGLCVCVCV